MTVQVAILKNDVLSAHIGIKDHCSQETNHEARDHKNFSESSGQLIRAVWTRHRFAKLTCQIISEFLQILMSRYVAPHISSDI